MTSEETVSLYGPEKECVVKVLIADGNIVRLDIAQSFLWHHGHEVEIATDGLECFAALEDFQPDLLVLDADLLRVGSTDLLAKLDGFPAYRSTPVVLLERCRQRASDAKSMENLHVVARLARPVGLNELLGAIESHGQITHVDVPPLTLHAL